ncbi:MAG: ATP-binding cassette domain-containing protein [Pseudomonadota bacterium]
MLDVQGLSATIGATTIVRDAVLRVETGEMCGLIGRNGAGKTTLIRALMGLVPGTGHAQLEGSDLIAMPNHRRAHQGIGYMPEDRRLVPEFTAEQNIRFPIWSLGLPDGDQRLAWIQTLMPELEALLPRRALQLSGGQQKLVALGRALMAGRNLLLLDEPFEGLAPALARRLAEVISALKETGEAPAVLIADSNDMHTTGLLDRVYRIERGVVASPEAAAA